MENLSRRQKSFYCSLFQVTQFLVISLLHIHLTDADTAPTIQTFTMTHSSAAEGARVASTPYVRGFPRPTITFYKEGVGLLAQRDVFIIESVTKADAGNYWIIANNSVGAAISNKLSLAVYYTNPWTNSNTSLVMPVIDGDAVVIKLPSIDAHPQPDVTSLQWYYSNSGTEPITPVNPDESFHITADLKLIILNVQTWYNGHRYQAEYINHFLSERILSKSNVFTLQVSGANRQTVAPTFVVELPAVSLVERQAPHSLECVVNARPLSALDIKWYKIEAGTTQRIDISRNSAQYGRINTITNFATGDKYLCEATAGGVTITSDTTISVLETPTFVGRLELRYTADLGGQQSLPCKVTSNPPANVTWYKNAVEVTSSERLVISSNGSLNLLNVQLADTAVYQCYAENQAGYEDDQTYFRLNSAPPSFAERPQNQTLIGTGDASVRCVVDGQPTPNVTWMFRSSVNPNPSTTELRDGGRFTVTRTSVAVRSAIWSDSGAYICSAVNSLGSDEATAHITVYNETIVLRGEDNVEEEKSRPVTRTCMLNKDSRISAQILWFHNGSALTLDTYRTLENNNQTLKFSPIRSFFDQGQFTCRVYSEAGNGTQSYNITIIEIPLRPDASAALAARRMITITWRKPFDGNRPIINYAIRFRENSTNPAWTILNPAVPSSARSFDAIGLKPSKTYEFVVTAVNNIGEGQWSESTTPVRIPPEAPSRPPVIESLVAISNRSVRVRFSAPPKDYWNSERLLGYKIEHRATELSEPLGTITYNTSSEGILATDIENLLADTDYWVRVAAFNEVPADLTYSELRKIRTLEGLPQVAPTITGSSAVSSTECRIEWREPDQRTINGQTRGYYVKAFKGDSSRVSVSNNVTSHRETESTTVASLDKYTSYRIEVRLYTGGGASPGAVTNCRTLQDTPEAIAQLNVSAWTHESISVSWLPPSVTNGILTHYNVSISGSGTGSGRSFQVPRNVTTKTIGNLSSSSSYTVTVRAATIIGAGPPTSVSRNTRDPPSKPSKATILPVADENIESRSVLLTYALSDDGDAPVTKWIVESQNEERSNWSIIAQITDFSSESSELLIEDLRPYHRYYFRITAENIAGPSEEPSDSTGLITTDMAPPDGPPVNITMRAQNRSTLIINWEPLDADSFNGKDGGYKVQYKSSYEESWRNATVGDPRSRFYILDELEAYTVYTVRVISVNTEYESEPSESAQARTIEYVPEQGPSSISVASTRSNEVDISWPAVSDRHANGVILGYRVVYKPEDSADEPLTSTTQGRAATIVGLLAYTKYSIKVLAYTGIGDGVASRAILVTTVADRPSAPRSLSMLNIESNSLSLIWLEPEHPNSEPSSIKYILSYGRTGGAEADMTVVADYEETSYDVRDLESGIEYTFEVKATNNVNEGPSTSLTYRVISPALHRVPDVPLDFAVEGNSILRWRAGADNGLPIRNYTLWHRLEAESLRVADVFIAGDLERYTPLGLKPDTKYYFQLAAMNDKGQSQRTQEVWFKTVAEKPSAPPTDIQVVPKTATALNITWTAASRDTWNGQPTNTRIWYAVYEPNEVKDISLFLLKDVAYPLTTTMLEGLEAGYTYEIRLGSGNSVGFSTPSQPIIIYVGVAVPVGAPSEISSADVRDQKITISWNRVSESETNGQLLGYKVYYKVMDIALRKRRALDSEAQYDLVGPEETSHTLSELEIFKEYQISVTAYNIAGEGPRSPVITATTAQGKPGPPANLTVTEITLTLVNVTWDVPAEPNGLITHYILNYYRHDAKLEEEAGGDLSSSRLITHPTTYDEIKVNRNTTYNFTISAVTEMGKGAFISKSFTAGPRIGAPSAPSEAEYSTEESGVLVKWTPGEEGETPIIGFVIEGLIDDDWFMILREEDPSAEKVVLSEEQLAVHGPYRGYQVSLFNSKGLGEATDADEVTPFYKNWWFLVIIALVALVIIIIITAVLCCYCYRMRAKLAEEAYEQDVIGVEENYNTYEMRQSFKRENRRASNKYRAEPPRPSPGAVMYSTDDAPPRYDDNSSVTEKGDMSSDEDDETKGNASATDSSDDDIDKTGGASSVTPSYNNYQYGGYNPYVQSGAVQQSWQNSFGRGRNQPSMYAYTDSEAESSIAPSTSHYRSTNGLLSGQSNARNNSRQHLANSSPDLPGSRTPLPNFSSFV